MTTDYSREQECANGCGWLFHPARIDARYCNVCGGNQLHPRSRRIAVADNNQRRRVRTGRTRAVHECEPATPDSELVGVDPNLAVENDVLPLDWIGAGDEFGGEREVECASDS